MTSHTNGTLQRRRGRKPVTWRTITGLILVPLTIAGVLLWALWNPQDRLDTVTAAVVNLDEPAEVDGQTVPLGRVLAGELIGEPDGGSGSGSTSASVKGSDADQNLDWQLTDAEDAADGLDDGRYATVVTIPENFSEAATSLSTDPEKPEQARIDIESSDRGRLIDNVLTNIVTQTATAVLNQTLGEQFVGGVFVGMQELGDGIGEAADGASELADGGGQLADGASQLADGTQQLAEGSGELASGAGDLAMGAGELASGAGDLANGAGELSSGAGDLATNMRAFASGDGAGNPGLAGLATNVETYTGSVNDALTGLQTGVAGAIEPLTQYRDAVAAGIIPLPPGTDRDAVVAQLDELIAGLQDPEAQAGLDQLRSGGAALAEGARSAADGADQLATGAEGLAGGAEELATGASGLSSGASQLAGGASQLSGGLSQLSAQTPELAEGAGDLADGARASADGADELATGLAEASDGVPDYTEAQRDRIAETAIEPVAADGMDDELFNASGVPLFAGVALWAGGLAMFMVLAPLWRRTREAALGVGTITLRSVGPTLLLGAVQGGIAGLALPIVLGYDFARGVQFAGVALLAGTAFALVNQGLVSLLGGLGRFLSFALLVVGFAVGIVATVPGPLQTVGDASPIGAAFSGFGAVATGASGAGVAVFLLVLWALAGIALTALAVIRRRRTTRPE